MWPTCARRASCSTGSRVHRSRTASREASSGSASGVPPTRTKTGPSSAHARPPRSSMASSSRPAPAPERHVLALFGPTASGKTAVAGVLRERLGAEVVSADSAALYDGLPIITAAPEYPALLVGGTGLYFRAALSAMQIPPPGRRAHWQAEVERLGLAAAHALLSERDPDAAARVHPNDRKRVVRALELWDAGASLAPATDQLWTEDTRLPTTIVALEVPL